jgi:chromosomal replication initiation ATPase DnaA
MNTPMTETRQKQIFLDLVSRQKNRGGAADNLQAEVAERYGISLSTLKTIEREGLARDWPPLD